MRKLILWLCLVSVGGCSPIGSRPPSSGAEPAGSPADKQPLVDKPANNEPPSGADEAGSGGEAAETNVAGTGGQPPAASPAGEAAAARPDAGSPQPSTADENAGGHAGGDAKPARTPIARLDLLFVVDNTNSMAGEQQSLQAALPQFIQALTTGVSRSTWQPAFPPVRDVHIGVVSTDMGTVGFDFSSCRADGGDDGRLQSKPRGPDCAVSYPAFLSYGMDTSEGRKQLARDFACVAGLGTGGCGFEQSLEAAFKALWPSTFHDATGEAVDPNPYTFLASTPEGTKGRGDVPAAQGGNLGFLRNDADDPSLIAIVVVTDEDDCSAFDTEFLKPASQLASDSPYRTQDINLRCLLNKNKLYDVAARYAKGLHWLRLGDPRRVVFAAITGIPTELVDAQARAGLDFKDTVMRDKFYDRVLNDPRMQEVIDPTTNPGLGAGNLTPSCSRMDATGQPSTAYPPRRIVQLAKSFGEQGIVQSICQDDFAPAIDAVVELIARQLTQ